MVRKKSQWAVGSNQYLMRAGLGRTNGLSMEQNVDLSTPERDQEKFDACGITWRDFAVDQIQASSLERARHRFRAQFPVLIWNAAALEGNNFTLPEVQTLLGGSTVAGKSIEDERQILSLSEAYSRLDEIVGEGTFSLSKKTSDELHGLLAVHEALDAGRFRGEGQGTGGGTVRLARGGHVDGTPHGEGGSALREHYDDLIRYLSTVDGPRKRALIYFASATRRQFYFDGNKRTARLMLAGLLMSNGFDIVSVPFSRRLEFNQALDLLFAEDEATELLAFLATCDIG